MYRVHTMYTRLNTAIHLVRRRCGAQPRAQCPYYVHHGHLVSDTLAAIAVGAKRFRESQLDRVMTLGASCTRRPRAALSRGTIGLQTSRRTGAYLGAGVYIVWTREPVSGVSNRWANCKRLGCRRPVTRKACMYRRSHNRPGK
jgi:hypothetical protein